MFLDLARSGPGAKATTDATDGCDEERISEGCHGNQTAGRAAVMSASDAPQLDKASSGGDGERFPKGSLQPPGCESTG
eukprot:516798-Rhodomonas_salina.2